MSAGVISLGIGPPASPSLFILYGLGGGGGALPAAPVAAQVGPGVGRGIPQDVWVVPAALEVDRLVEVESLEAINNELDDLHKEHRKIERKFAQAESPAMRRETRALADYLIDQIDVRTAERTIIMEHLRIKKVQRNRKLKQQAIAAEATRQEQIAQQRLISLRKARERKRALDAVKKTSLKQ
jgi:hypothetical protein